MPKVGKWRSTEFVGGLALFLAVICALAIANSPLRDSYESFRHFQIGFGIYRFDVKTWAADGLLAIFFASAGLELRRELAYGDLRNRRRTALPVIAALCGMAGPALIYALITRGDAVALHAWAIPTSTDLAFSLTILGIAGSRIPSALRAFLLTLAITDDIATIVLIAIFYSQTINWRYLIPSLLVLAAYALLQRRGITWWWIALPLGVCAWALMQQSGVHATVAGVLIGLLTNPHRNGNPTSAVERFEHSLAPISAFISVPVFAFVTIGISLSSSDLATLWHDKIAYGIILARLIGKVLGIVGGAWLISKITRAELSPGLSWWDISAVGILAGIGFAVSLLVALVSLGNFPNRLLAAESGILFSGLISALLAIAALQIRNRAHLHPKSAH